MENDGRTQVSVIWSNFHCSPVLGWRELRVSIASYILMEWYSLHVTNPGMAGLAQCPPHRSWSQRGVSLEMCMYPWKVTERNKSDKSDSIVNRFYQERSIKTSMVALISDTCTRSATKISNHSTQKIPIQQVWQYIRYIEYYRIAWMYSCCQKRATSAVKQFPFVLHWHVRYARFQFSIFGIIIRFSLESFVSRRAHQPNQSNHQRRPDCREVSSETMAGCKDQASKVAEALGLVTLGGQTVRGHLGTTTLEHDQHNFFRDMLDCLLRWLAVGGQFDMLRHGPKATHTVPALTRLMHLAQHDRHAPLVLRMSTSRSHRNC